MLLFVDRRRRDDRFLEWKVWIFSVAAALVLVGIYTDSRWMTGTALVLLLGAMFLRFLPGGDREGLAEDDEDEYEQGEGGGDVGADDCVDDGRDLEGAR